MATLFAAEPDVVETPLIYRIAAANGDLSPFFAETELANLGSRVVEDYERDCAAREPWAKKARDAIKAAAQEGDNDATSAYTASVTNAPYDGASDIRYPILTIAATEFNARAYPAIVKGDETVQVKVIGADKGRPVMGPEGPMVSVNGQLLAEIFLPVIMQQAEAAQQPVDVQPAWEVAPGAKSKRAGRVKEFLNVLINYRMDDWEGDTDALLYQLPIVGCAFRKKWWDARKGIPAARFVPALRLVVPCDAVNIETAPRITEEIPDVFPYQIKQRMARGEYRTAELGSTADSDGDEQAARMLLEQHRLIDLDGDGYEEPYIVTVDRETRQVLSIVAAFDVADIAETASGIEIERTPFYVKYDFFPHPEGKFYGIGFGHLLAELGAAINTTINQIIDAGHAQIAGGGFIAGGLRIQGNGKTNTLRWRPGEYKVIEAQGGTLQGSIYERTFPAASPIMYNMLDLLLGSAKDVAAIKDILSGESGSANMPVGTVMALIDQGLQVFSAIYKRVYRGLKAEFTLDYRLLGRYATERTVQDYMTVLDDPEANFETDFSASDMDIRPVSDPGSVTRMQKVAKAQFLMETGAGDPNVDQRELKRRVWEAADIDDIDKLLPAPDPNAPPPPEAVKLMSEAGKNDAQKALYEAQAAQIGFEIGRATGEAEQGVPEAQEPQGMPFSG